MKKLFLLLSLFYLLLIAQTNIRVSTSVNKTKIKLNENFTYTIKIEGLKSPISQPKLPEILGAEVKGFYQTVEPSSDQGFIYCYHYIISPNKSGQIFLQDFNLKISDLSFKLKGFSVEVLPVEDKTSSKNEEIFKEENYQKKPDIFLEGEISKSLLYEGEPFIYSLHLLTRESVRNFEIVEKPSFDNIRKIEIQTSKFPKTSKIERGGKYFIDAIVYKAILIPLKEGEIAINDFVAEAKIEGNKIIKLIGGFKKFKVLPLPPKVQGFKGSIGSFDVQLITKDLSKLKVNEIFEIEITVEGKGIISQEPFEIKNSPFFQYYGSKSEDLSSEDKKDDLFIKKRYKLIFSPNMSGTKKVPEIKFVYFDPSKKDYIEKNFNNIEINAIGNEIEKTQEKVLKVLPPKDFPSQIIYSNKGLTKKNLLIPLLPFILYLLILTSSKLFESVFLTEERKRKRRLQKELFFKIKKAKSKLDAKTSNEFHKYLREALEKYLEIILNKSVSSMTRTEIESELKSKEIDDQKVKEILLLIEEINRAEFSSEKVMKIELKNRFEKLKKVINSIELKKIIIITLLLLSVGNRFISESNEKFIFEKGLKEQLRGNYSESLKYYKYLENEKIVFPELYYNIANNLLELGRIGEAILYYKKALKLNKDFLEAKENLKTAQELLKVKSEEYERSPFSKMILSINEPLFFKISLILISLSSVIFILRIFFTKFYEMENLKIIGAILLITGLLLLGLLFIGIDIKEKEKSAIILEDTILYEKRTEDSKALANLKEGTEVILEEHSINWSKIKCGEGIGFVKTNKIGVVD